MSVNKVPGLDSLKNYRMAQPTKWAPAILDYMRNVKSECEVEHINHDMICETEHSEV